MPKLKVSPVTKKDPFRTTLAVLDQAKAALEEFHRVHRATLERAAELADAVSVAETAAKVHVRAKYEGQQGEHLAWTGKTFRAYVTNKRQRIVDVAKLKKVVPSARLYELGVLQEAVNLKTLDKQLEENKFDARKVAECISFVDMTPAISFRPVTEGGEEETDV